MAYNKCVNLHYLRKIIDEQSLNVRKIKGMLLNWVILRPKIYLILLMFDYDNFI